MNKIENLIAQHCPNGVEYKELGEVCEIKRGQRVTKTQLVEGGLYPVISGGMNPLGYFNDFNRKAQTITIAQYGTAGYVNWQHESFWANDVCYSLYPLELLNNRYLYFCLLDKQNLIYSLTTNAVPSHLPIDRLKQIQIPVLPLVIQKEIVNILDKFTELEKELEKELELRRKQYEHYRNALLNFTPPHNSLSVKWLRLFEISAISTGKNKSKKSAGKYPVYGSTGLIGYCDSYKYSENLILIARVGANAGYINIIIEKCDISDNTLIVRLSKDYNIRFIYHYLINMNLNKYAKGGGQPLITAADVKKIQIPIPPREEQQRIVDILDKFDALINDLSSGLPAEIIARRAQYEYYREKLLSFTPIAS